MSRTVRLSVLLVLCACAASPACASSARLFALGGDGAYLEDAVNARVWYGSLVDHGGWAALESGVFSQEGYARDATGWRATGPAAGVHVPIGAEGRHGTAALWWNGRLANGGAADLGGDRLADAWQVQYGRRLGPLTAGLSVRHGGGEHDPTPSVHRATTRDDFALGARFDLGAGAYADLAGELVRLAEKNSVDQGEPQSLSNAGSYGLRARAFVGVGDGLVLVPVVERVFQKRTAFTVDGEDRWSLWRLGAGLTWLPDPDHLVLLSCDWRDGEATTARADTWNHGQFAVNLAVEARIHALLSARLAGGYRRVHESVSDSDAVGTTHEVPVSAGLAAHLGPADLEFALTNLPPVLPGGTSEPWTAPDASTWMSAGLSWWF